MIARHRRHEALRGALPERVLVDAVGRAEGRADLGEGAEALHLFLVQQEVLRTGLGPDPLAFALRPLDALEAEPGREVDDIDGTLGELADQDGAIDRLFFRPVGAGGWEIHGRRAPRRDGLVLEVAEDIAVLAVELADAAQSP